MQDIATAHLNDPANPDYSHAEMFMGFEGGSSGVIVAPAQEKLTSERIKERSQMMKEQRKHNEELRLRRPTQKSEKGGGKGQDVDEGG